MNAPAYTPTRFDDSVSKTIGKPASSDIERRVKELKSGFLTGMFRGDHFRALLDNIAKDNQRLNRWRFPALLLRMVSSLAAVFSLVYVIGYGWNHFIRQLVGGVPMDFTAAAVTLVVIRMIKVGGMTLEKMNSNKAEQERRAKMPWFDLFKERFALHCAGIAGYAFVFGIFWLLAK